MTRWSDTERRKLQLNIHYKGRMCTIKRPPPSCNNSVALLKPLLTEICPNILKLSLLLLLAWTHLLVYLITSFTGLQTQERFALCFINLFLSVLSVTTCVLMFSSVLLIN